MSHDADYLFALKLQEELDREEEGAAAIAAPPPKPVSDFAYFDFACSSRLNASTLIGSRCRSPLRPRSVHTTFHTMKT